jgi:hypothetical protein
MVVTQQRDEVDRTIYHAPVPRTPLGTGQRELGLYDPQC